MKGKCVLFIITMLLMPSVIKAHNINAYYSGISSLVLSVDQDGIKTDTTDLTVTWSLQVNGGAGSNRAGQAILVREDTTTYPVIDGDSYGSFFTTNEYGFDTTESNELDDKIPSSPGYYKFHASIQCSDDGGYNFHTITSNTVIVCVLFADDDEIIYQHKDSKMSCYCISPSIQQCWAIDEEGSISGHYWDRDHITYHEDCPHCNHYCTRAAIKMASNHFGGSISQDYISFRILGCGHNMGMYVDNPQGVYECSPFAWALGLEDDDITVTGSSWTVLANSLAAGCPVIVTKIEQLDPLILHSVFIAGCKLNENNVKRIKVHDPARGVSWTDFDSYNIYETFSTNTAELTPEIMPGSLYMDADSDGLVYYYETALFTELKDYYNCTMSDTSAYSTGEELSDHNLVEYYYHVVQYDP